MDAGESSTLIIARCGVVYIKLSDSNSLWKKQKYYYIIVANSRIPKC